MLTPDQYLIYNKLNTGKTMEIDSSIVNLELEELEIVEVWWEENSLSTIKGIWPSTLRILSENKIKTIADLKKIWEVGVRRIITNPLSLKGIINFLNSK